MDGNKFKKSTKGAPTKPGIYIFKKGDKKLYIGKAANLKSRLRSYLKTADPRIQKMLSISDGLEFRPTISDIEALILESQLIKDFRPQFNIVMRDDKQYFHVGFTEDVFPKLFLTHQPQGFEAEFIGPFTDGAVLKSTLKFLRKIFPYCTCKNPHNNFCLNYHIGRCIGFCCLKNKKYDKKVLTELSSVLTDYKRNIRALKEVLNGKRKSLIKDLAKEMSLAAKKEDFETAIGIRGKIEGLERIFENARVIKAIRPQENNLKELARIFKLKKPPFRIEGYDISNIQGTNATGSMVVFEDGVPNKSQYRKFKIRSKRTPDDTLMLGEMLQRRFNHPEWRKPDLILMDGGKGQLNAARAAIYKSQTVDNRLAKSVIHSLPIIALAKGKYEIFSTTLEKPISMSKLPQNVRNLIKNIDAEAHRFAIDYYRRLHAKRLLS